MRPINAERVTHQHKALIGTLLDEVTESVIQELVRAEQELEARTIIQAEVSNGLVYRVPATLARLLNDKERFSILVDTLKVGSLAGHEYVRGEWNSFAVAISQYPHHARALAKLLTVVEDLDLSAEWLNKGFIPCLNADCLVTLTELRKTTEMFYTEIQSLALHQAEQWISEWEAKVPEWADPNAFKQLVTTFQSTFGLIDSLSYDKSQHEFTQIKIQSLVKRFTNLIDESIKTLKGSPKYATEENLKSRVRNMATLLEPLRQLMVKWVGYQADRTGGAYTKEQVLAELNTRFQRLCAEAQDVGLSVDRAKELTLPSAGYSNDGVVYRPGADERFKDESFKKLIVDDHSPLTLEDIYTLMHQNTLNGVFNLAPVSSTLYSPPPLKQFAELFGQTYLAGGDYWGTGRINCSGPHYDKQGIHYDFHCTLGKHHFTMKLDYDKAQKRIAWTYEMFEGPGGDEHGRFTDIRLILKLLLKHLHSVCPDLQMLKLNIPKLEFKVSFNYNEFTPQLIRMLHDAVSGIAIRTYRESVREGQFFLPDVFVLDVNDLCDCAKNGGGVQLIPEMAYKLKELVNTPSASGELPLFVILGTIKASWDLKRFRRVLLNPHLDYDRKNSMGESLIECIKNAKFKNFQIHLLSHLLLAAIARSDLGMIQQISKEPDFTALVTNLLSELMSSLEAIDNHAKWHDEYRNWIIPFYLNVITNKEALEQMIPLIDKNNRSLIEVQENLTCLIDFIASSKKFVETLPEIFESPLFNAKHLVKEYSSTLWNLAEDPLLLKMAMDSGKITDDLIERCIVYGKKYPDSDTPVIIERLEGYKGYQAEESKTFFQNKR